MNDRGEPLSWKHYQYGVAYLQRFRAREKLLVSSAVIAARAGPEHYERWREIMLRAAEMSSE